MSLVTLFLFCNTQLKLSIFIIVVRGITGIIPEALIPLLLYLIEEKNLKGSDFWGEGGREITW